MNAQQALQQYALRKDARAFHFLVREYQCLVYAAARRRLTTSHDIDDVVQLTFLKLANAAGTIRRGEGALSAWLYTTALHAASDLIRRDQARRRHEALAPPPQITDQQQREQWQQLSFLVDETLLELPADQQHLLIEHFFHNRSQRDLAAELALSQSTMTRRLDAAVNALRTLLKSRGCLVAPALLAFTLPQLADAQVPAALTSQLTKIGLTGAGPRVTAVPLFSLSLTAKGVLAAGIMIFLLSTLLMFHVFAPAPFPPTIPVGIATSAPSPAAPEPLINVFPRGGTVELIAVNSSADPKTWWSPDGTPRAQPLPGADFTTLRDPWGETRTTYQFAWRITDLPPDAGPLYLNVYGNSRLVPKQPLQRDSRDPALYYGAALLYPDQTTLPRLSIMFASKPLQHLVFDSTGAAIPPLPEGSDMYVFLGPPIRTSHPSFERDGKTFLVVNAEPWGNLDYQVAAITREGASKPASDVFLGPVTGVNRLEKYATSWFSAWAFDAPLRDIARYEVSIRRIDQLTAFQNVALRSGQHSSAAPFVDKPGQKVSYDYDSAFSNLFYAIENGIEDRDLPAAAKICGEVLRQARTRRAQLAAGGSPYLFVVDHGLPVLAQLDEALRKKDLAQAVSLLETSTGSGVRLLNSIQTLARYTAIPAEN